MRVLRAPWLCLDPRLCLRFCIDYKKSFGVPCVLWNPRLEVTKGVTRCRLHTLANAGLVYTSIDTKTSL